MEIVKKFNAVKEGISIFATESAKTVKWLMQSDDNGKRANLTSTAAEVEDYLTSTAFLKLALPTILSFTIASGALAFRMSQKDNRLEGFNNHIASLNQEN